MSRYRARDSRKAVREALDVRLRQNYGTTAYCRAGNLATRYHCEGVSAASIAGVLRDIADSGDPEFDVTPSRKFQSSAHKPASCLRGGGR